MRRFGDRVVLDHLRLQIAASEFVVLLGPSGCGKTTLLRLLAGLDRPDGGTVSVPTARAIVLQGARLLPWQRVWQNVIIGLYGPDAGLAALSVLGEAGLSERPARGPGPCPAARPGVSHWPVLVCRTRRSSCSTSRSPRSTR